ncbi:MAG: 50S ribosomal protein L10 [Chloroflexi bacterium]|nr:MAG: 50S ribosomal protein L10 [Chloroflexota bacterium]
MPRTPSFSVVGNEGFVFRKGERLKVMEFQGLRKRLRDRHVEYHVVKNSLLSRAATKTQREGLRSFLSGPTAVALSSGDEVELAKGLMDETKTLKALRVLGGLLGGQTVSAAEITALSKLPGKPQLQAEIVGSLQAPLAQMVGLINAPFQAIVHVFSARGSSS